MKTEYLKLFGEIFSFVALLTVGTYFVGWSLPLYRYTVERHYLDGGCDTVEVRGHVPPRVNYSRFNGYKDAVCRIRLLKKEKIK